MVTTVGLFKYRVQKIDALMLEKTTNTTMTLHQKALSREKTRMRRGRSQRRAIYVSMG